MVADETDEVIPSCTSYLLSLLLYWLLCSFFIRCLRCCIIIFIFIVIFRFFCWPDTSSRLHSLFAVVYRVTFVVVELLIHHTMYHSIYLFTHTIYPHSSSLLSTL